MCIEKKKTQPRKQYCGVFFGSVLQSYIYVYELTQMSIKDLFQIGSNKETICTEGSYPHVTIGLAVVVVNRIIGKNSERDEIEFLVFSCFFPHYKVPKEIALPKKSWRLFLSEPLNCIAYSRSHDRDGGSDE